MHNVPIYKPQLPSYDLIEPDIRKMYESQMLYPSTYTLKLEERVRDLCQVRFTHAVSSCSLALNLLTNLLPRNSKVILPAFTFSATLEAIEWAGQIPLVVDVDENGQLNPEKVIGALEENKNVSAILAVNMWGNVCHPEQLESIAAAYGVRLFFDAAHNLGTTYKGRAAGTYGHATAHSIAATKPISAGEGGLILSNYHWVDTGVRDGSCHGLVGNLDTRIRGTNGKIQEFNSILALHALDMFTPTKARRAELMNCYRAHFKDHQDIRIWQNINEFVDPMYKDAVIFVRDGNPVTRAKLEKHLNNAGVGTKRYFDPAVPDMGSFQGQVHSSQTARSLSASCLTIPLYPQLTDDEQSYILENIDAYFRV